MKKSVIKISLAFVIIAAVILFLLILLSRDSEPSYSFLAGRSPVACRDVKKGSVDKCYSYSFEADFNDVCSNAGAELISEGFVDRTLPGRKTLERDYWLKSSFPRGPIRIKIYNNRKYVEHPISKKGGLGPGNGWVVVEIMYWRWW
jgi:hypothetical protein